MPDARNKFYYLQVQNCPAESDVPADIKTAHRDSMRKCFGNDFRVVKCEAVRNEHDMKIFCEMVIKSDHCNMNACPSGVKIILVQDDVL